MGIKNRHIYNIQVKDCPMGYDNCLSCEYFYCGVTISIHEPCGAAVLCGWSKENQKRIEERQRTIITKS